jgi:hypothetical protein
LRELARSYNQQIVADRGMDTEARVLEVIRDLGATGEAKLSMKEITDLFVERHQDEYERKIAPKWVGNIVRKKLNLKTRKSEGVFVIPPEELPRLAHLYAKYGIESKTNVVEKAE